jgi:hypothetical protein
MLNKRGTDKVISVYWFAILILVSGGIFAMVYVFYSYPYDVRGLEAELLTNKISDCLSYGGVLRNDFFVEGQVSKGFKESFLKDCGISFNAEKRWEGVPQYYFKVNVFEADNLVDSITNLTRGNLNIVSSCGLQKSKEFQNLAKCNERRLYSTLNGKQYLIDILSIAKKTEKNVKQ